MIKIIEESLDDLEYYQKKNEDYRRLSESALIVLSCFKEKPELRLRPAEIVMATGIPRRTVSHVLSDLTKKHFLQKHGQRAGIRYQLVF